MDDKLNILITYYEEEQKRLLQTIDDCVKDDEFKLAHFHQKALYQVNRNLQNLRNFDDKLYREKNFRQNKIYNFEKMLKSGDLSHLNDFLLKRIAEEKEILNELNSRPKEESTPDSLPIFDEVLTDLLDKKIKSFRLVLKKTDNLLLEFNYRNKTLKAALPSVKQHLKKYTLRRGNIRSLENLDFHFTQNKNRLVLKLSGSKEDITSRLKIILSKIVFEIFYFREFDNESYIEIKK